MNWFGKLFFRLLILLAKLKFRLTGWLARRSGKLRLLDDTTTSVSENEVYQNRYFNCVDGLRLHFRDYSNDTAETTVLCLHGLTRNSQDFEETAAWLSQQFRVVVPDQRGRGFSEFDKKPQRYRPDTYVQDMLQLIELLQLDRIILLGTSMGALMSIMLAAMRPTLFVGMILNEAGPVVEVKGLERIKEYLRGVKPVSTWTEAETMCRQMYGPAFPGFSNDDWSKYTRRTWLKDSQGQPLAAYDPAISRITIEQSSSAVPPNLWPLFEMTQSVPTLVLRGEISEILSEDTVNEMCNRHPDCYAVTITNVGHAPTLTEPQAVTAIQHFCARFRSADR